MQCMQVREESEKGRRKEGEGRKKGGEPTRVRWKCCPFFLRRVFLEIRPKSPATRGIGKKSSFPPKGPFRTKNATTSQSIVNYYGHSFLLSSVICYHFSSDLLWHPSKLLLFFGAQFGKHYEAHSESLWQNLPSLLAHRCKSASA